MKKNINNDEIEIQLINKSKGTIIFYGNATIDWFCYWQNHIQQINTVKTKAVCVDEPRKDNKLKQDVSKAAFMVMDDKSRLATYVDDFISKLKKP